MDSSRPASWHIAFTAAAAVIGAVAALLLAIIAVARSILGHAAQILELAHELEGNTEAIWNLEHVNHEAAMLQQDARSIAEHAGQIADALGSGSGGDT